jgi:hypothetical protein
MMKKVKGKRQRQERWEEEDAKPGGVENPERPTNYDCFICGMHGHKARACPNVKEVHDMWAERKEERRNKALSNAATNLEPTQHTVRRGSVFMLRKVEPTKLEAKLMNRAYTLHIEDQCAVLAKSTAHIMTSVKKKQVMTY